MTETPLCSSCSPTRGNVWYNGGGLTKWANFQLLNKTQSVKSSSQASALRMSLTFVKDDFVTKNHHVELTVRDKAIQNVPARLASGFDVQGTYANDAPRSWLC